jgi:Aspartyl protease
VTVLTETAAARIGVTPAMLQADRLERGHETGGNGVGIHMHRFAEFRIGPDVFRNVPIAVAPIPTHVDMLLGLDYARTRDIWLSYSTRQLFVALPAAPQPQASR